MITRNEGRTRAVGAVSLAAALWLGLAPPARACSVCGCGDPLLAASDPAAITGALRVQLDTELVRVEAASEAQPGRTDRLTQWSHRLNAVYRPVDPVALSATVPWVAKEIHAVGGERSSSLRGLGDVEVAARWAPWTEVEVGRRRVQELALQVGAALPTGKKDARAADGALIDPHGQLGTGGWGPFAGLHYRLEQGDWMGFASASYRLRTEARYFDRSRYRFGDAVLWSVHGQYRPVQRLALDLGVDGRHAWADHAVDAGGTVTPRVEATGGTVLSVAPGVYVRALGELWLFARAQVPLVKRLRGEQDVLTTFDAGLQVQVY